jgi:hypothetical protein
MCHRNSFMCTTEDNYMYCSTLNLCSAVHDKKYITLKKELQYTSNVQKNISGAAVQLCVLLQIICTAVHYSASAVQVLKV